MGLACVLVAFLEPAVWLHVLARRTKGLALGDALVLDGDRQGDEEEEETATARPRAIPIRELYTAALQRTPQTDQASPPGNPSFPFHLPLPFLLIYPILFHLVLLVALCTPPRRLSQLPTPSHTLGLFRLRPPSIQIFSLAPD